MNPPEKKPLTKPTLPQETPFLRKYSVFESLIKSKAPTPKQLYSILFYIHRMRSLVLSLGDAPLVKLPLLLNQVTKSEQMFRIYLSRANLERDLENVSLRDLEKSLSHAIKSKLRIGSSVLSYAMFLGTRMGLTNSAQGSTDIKD